MFELHRIKNDMGCEMSISCSADRTARLAMISTRPDFSNADSAVESFRKELKQLSFTEVNVKLEQGRNTLTVDCRFRLPRFLKNRKIRHFASAVVHAYDTHLVPLMKTRDDPRLGRLVWDCGLSRWTTDVALDGNTIELSLHDWGRRDLSETIRDAIDLIDNWDQWRAKIQETQILDLLNLYNEGWRDRDAPQITAAELKGRLSIVSIDCDDDGWRCVHFEQDELFTDHMIEMRISPDGDVEAVISG